MLFGLSALLAIVIIGPLPEGDVGDGDVPLLLAESPPHPAMTNASVPAAANAHSTCARASIIGISRRTSEQQPNPSTDLQTARVHLDCTTHARFGAGVQCRLGSGVPGDCADPEVRRERPSN